MARIQVVDAQTAIEEMDKRTAYAYSLLLLYVREEHGLAYTRQKLLETISGCEQALQELREAVSDTHG